ncbi:MAG: hypothetical protein Q7R35_03740 [Elusimicrobiota bacterium]|nr:hypothetical protein [Elusimicrobiota bacterium]
MTLTPTQRKLIWAALVTLAIMGSVPPWTYTFMGPQGNYSETPAGYSFIVSPPPKQKDSVFFGVKLDMGRLSVQFIGILTALGLGLLLTAKRKDAV